MSDRQLLLPDSEQVRIDASVLYGVVNAHADARLDELVPADLVARRLGFQGAGPVEPVKEFGADSDADLGVFRGHHVSHGSAIDGHMQHIGLTIDIQCDTVWIHSDEEQDMQITKGQRIQATDSYSTDRPVGSVVRVMSHDDGTPMFHVLWDTYRVGPMSREDYVSGEEIARV